MSVIVKDPRDGKLKLYCKGADNVLYDRLKSDYKPNGNPNQIDEWNRTLQSLRVFAVDGLRTLVCGYKELDKDQYCQWLQRLNKAKSAMTNRDILVEDCYDEIERDLVLLGATAIQDKLQNGVPETIANLSIAGISIWVLTGDKVETAINIGRSCRLLTHEMNREDTSLIVIDPDEKLSDDDCHRIVSDAFKDAWNLLQNHCDNDAKQGFVISGKALSCVFPHRKHDAKGREIPPSQSEAIQEQEYQQQLFKILTKCRAVICCRVSPIQKAQIVSLVKQNTKDVITLAIGDGANDVPMIRAAHVGIGISGQEGLQAVMASDYSIAQFRFLQDLILIHGAWNYRRISLLILYSFYKNVMLSMTQIWFSFYNGFSGTLFYDQFSGSCFNLIYTAMPVMLAAVIDRAYSKELARLCPELYENGIQNKSFNLKIFAFWFLEGVIHSILVFFTAVYFVDSTSITTSGKIVGLWTASTTMFTSIVAVATAKVMMETKSWTIWSVLFFFLSFASWFLFALIWSAIPISLGWPNWDIYAVAQVAMCTPQFWFVVNLATILCIFPVILVKFVRKLWKPTRMDVIEELEKKPKEREKFIDEILAYKESIKRSITKKKTVSPETMITYQDEEKEVMQKHIGENGRRASIQAVTPRLKSMKSDLGYTEFQIGNDHPDYIMSQDEYMHIASIQKTFSPAKGSIISHVEDTNDSLTNQKYSCIPNVDIDSSDDGLIMMDDKELEELDLVPDDDDVVSPFPKSHLLNTKGLLSYAQLGKIADDD